MEDKVTEFMLLLVLLAQHVDVWAPSAHDISRAGGKSLSNRIPITNAVCVPLCLYEYSLPN